MRKSRVLVIDDEQMIRWSVEQTLSAVGHDVIGAATAAEGLAAFRRTLPQVVFLDVRLPDGDGLSVLGKIKEESTHETAVIVMTAYGEVRTAVEAMRLGALDYLKKPFDFDELEVLVNRALETTDLKREVGELREEKKRTYSSDNIVGHSEKMQTVLSLLDKIAASNAATVLIQGENGTGKDLFAHAIHYRSRRATGPFVDIGCTAMPETLLESEVFGYEKGAFTDARATKRGLLELANGGTLFLDEIGDMPLSSQAKLLRVLDNKRFKRLGGTEDHQVDVRIVAATNKDLEVAVRERRFREDLYYRLKVIPVVLPPLRQRRDDIPALLQHYMEKYGTEFHKDFRQVSEAALRLLLDYPWPGNVRELRNLVERIMILESGDTILPEHLPPEMCAGTRSSTSQPSYALPPSGICLEEVEKEFVRQALDLAQGNQTRAAQLLSISRDALRYRMQKFGLTG
jgi:two-component system, NtrC family, response regulator AtoC